MLRRTPFRQTRGRARRVLRTVAVASACAVWAAGCGLLSDGTTESKSPGGTAGATVQSTAAPLPTGTPTRPATTPPGPPGPATGGIPSAQTPSAAPSTGPGSSTIVPALQAAAERAVGGNAAASLIALDMRNGEIVSTVHRQAGMSGAVAPGSTFKIVTSALLLHKGVVKASSKTPCAKTTMVNGQQFHNIDDMVMPNATFREDFAHSCNTAFIDLRDRIGDAELSAFATRYFGLNSNAWKVAEGQGSVDGVVPPAVGDNDKAAQMIGQGALKMNPLTMASVVATALTGQFHQPVLQRGLPVFTRPDTLPAHVTAAIRTMMVDCATIGSAASLFKGMPGVGAKTGTAEVGDGTNGWMVAFRGNIAAAVYVEGGASGSSAAGPIIRDFLAAVKA